MTARSFQAYLQVQVDELARRLLLEYERQHGEVNVDGLLIRKEQRRHSAPAAGRDAGGGPVPWRELLAAEAAGRGDPPALRAKGASSSPDDDTSEGVSALSPRALTVKCSDLKGTNHLQPVHEESLLVPSATWVNGSKAKYNNGNPDLPSERGKGAIEWAMDLPSEQSKEGTLRRQTSKGTSTSLASRERPQCVGLKRAQPQEHSPRKSYEDGRPSTGGSTMGEEARTANCTDSYVIYPGSWWYRTWSNFISLLVLVSCFFTPMRFGFHESFESIRSLETVWDCFFALDILITFNVALINKEGLVTSRWSILIYNVLSVRFWIDLVATVPIDDIWDLCHTERSEMHQKVSNALGLLRLLRVNRMLILFREMQKNTRLNLMGVVVAKFVLFILLCTHTSGCIFYALAAHDDFGSETWVSRVDPSLPGAALATRYIRVLFWAVGTFKAGPAAGELVPNSNSEMLLACLTMMVNICLQTYLVSNMAALLTTADVRIYTMRNQLRQLEEFSKRYKLPKELRRQLVSCIRFKFASEQELDHNVLTLLPDLYRQRISHTLFEDIISGVDLFKDCAVLFLRRLHGSLSSTLYMPDQQLVNVDEPSWHLQIICEGEVEMRDRSGCIIGIVGKCETFSAVSFLCKVGQPFSVKTRSVSRILSLDHAMWDAACSAFPENLHQVKLNLLAQCQAKAEEFVEGCSGHQIYSELIQVVQSHMVMEAETGTALFCAAAARGDVTELKRLLMSRSPNGSDYDARTPLHLAACNGQVEVISLLLEAEAFVDPVDNFGRTPLLEACRARQMKTAQLLHDAGAVLGGSSVGTEKSKDGVVKLGAAEELCSAASDVEQLWYLRMLLSYGANPNVGDYDARTALHVACACGNKPAVELLVDHNGIDLDPRDNFGRTPLMEAVRHCHEGVARIMKAHGAFHGFVIDLKSNTDANGIPAGQELCQAAFANQISYLNNLLAFCDIDVDASDYDLRTALMLACAEGNMSIAVHLVQNGADINKKDRWGHTALSEARDHGHTELAEVLSQIVVHGTIKDVRKDGQS